MSGPGRGEPRGLRLRQRFETIHVAVRSVTESKAFTVRGGCTVRQLKWSLAERLGVPAELLVLVHCGRVLKESELLSHLRVKDESVSLRLMLSSQHPSAAPTCDPASEMVQSELTRAAVSSDWTISEAPDPESATPSPTSPLCLVDGLDSLGLTNSRSGFLPALQRQTKNQLLADPEMMHRLLGSSYMQNIPSTSSPQLTRQLILSNPQIQPLLQTNPEGDMLDNTDVITQVMELIKNPDMIEDVMHNEDRALDNLHPEQKIHDGFPKADTKSLKLSQIQIGASTMVATSSGAQQPTKRESNKSPPVFSRSSDPLSELTTTPRAHPNLQSSVTAAMKSLLQEITSNPGLMESLLSGPHVSSLLQCLSQNPDLAAQMLLSHPLFSGNPQLQQQMRQQIPLFLQQMQSPELLSAMLNPRAIEALLHIQQGLQTLAAEVPALIPTASINAAPEQASDTVLNSQSGSGPQVAMVTEQQQQQFVQQMLQALANTNHGVRVEEFQDELDHLSSMGFRDREANLQVLMNTGGDLTTAIQHLLSL